MEAIKLWVIKSRKAIVAGAAGVAVPVLMQWGLDSDTATALVTGVVSAVVVWFTRNGNGA